MKLAGLGEAELVAAIRRDFGGKGRGLELGIGDDAAVLRPGRVGKLLLTTDLLVENVDFRRSFHPPYLLGRKSLNVNLSDIAAMGGRPRWALLGLALPLRLKTTWVEEFFRGFRSACRDEDVLLVGGDLSAADKIMISVIVAGQARRVVTRQGARPGDTLFVSGPLGDAAGGLRLLKKAGRPGLLLKRRLEPGLDFRLRQAFLDPHPQVELGLKLAERRLASAMIDLSDGLSTDVHNLCRESRVGAEIWAENIPLSPELKKVFPSPLKLALHGGEDFQLLFASPRRSWPGLRQLSRSFPLTPIGRVVRGREIFLVGPGRRKRLLPARGWQHFLR
ncbi:MAG: thiamine-phosphate kinase [Candidatus Aminicenantales bacterium]